MMANTYKDILNILKKGPNSDLSEAVFVRTFDIILRWTQMDVEMHYFQKDFVAYIIRYFVHNSVYKTIVYEILISIFSIEELSKTLSLCEDIMGHIIQVSLNDVFDKNCKDSDFSCMLLSNITCNEANSSILLQNLQPLSDILIKLVCTFSTVNYNSNCTLDHLAIFLCNLSQFSEVKSILSQSDHCLLSKLVPYMNHDNVVRRKGIISLIQHCAVDSSIHGMMLSEEVDVLPKLLLPLAGPEEFDDEDNEKLPVELQFLPDSKTREPDAEIRMLILQTLHQLCATKLGRQYLRDHNTYIILKGLHKWDENEQVIMACENIVEILLRSEEEIGVDHLLGNTTIMDSTFEDITNILKKGPNSGLSEDDVMNTFDIICLLSCNHLEEIKKYFNKDFVVYIIQFFERDSVYKASVYKIFINIFSIEELSKTLISCEDIMAHIIQVSLNDIFDNNCKDSDLSCMLLSNVTRSEANSSILLNHLQPISGILIKLVGAFSTESYNSNCTLNHLAMFLCNLSQLSEVRSILSQSGHCLLHKLVPFMNHDSVVRRRGVIGVIHNCAFDSGIHDVMLSEDLDVLPKLLLPLAGPEEFDDEDNAKLPVELQFLSNNKSREPEAEIRKQILETLNQLCATKLGRQYLRDHNTYIILRELHKWEEDEELIMACENVVDILIRTEEEIGVDHLLDIKIPQDIEERLNIANDKPKQ